MTQHPITPPPELVQKWFTEQRGLSEASRQHIATRAAQWGADQELEACCEYLVRCAQWEPEDVDELRAERRPEPPSMKEQALVALHAVATGANDMREQRQDFETIRLALEQLDG
jgi:hypothetical protein